MYMTDPSSSGNTPSPLEEETAQTLADDLADTKQQLVKLGRRVFQLSSRVASVRHEDQAFFEDIPDDIRNKARLIEKICKKHDVPMGAAALQFVLAHPVVVSVIPGSQTLSELETNIRYVEAGVPAELWLDLRSEGVIGANAPIPGE